MKLIDRIKKLEPDKAKHPFLHTLYDGFFTFLYVPNTVTKGGVHIRDGMDLKRTMIYVVIALQLCYIFGTWNVGHQHFLALGINTGYFEALHLKIAYGLTKIVPIFIWTYLVGLGIEFYFASRKGHGIEEGFLVTGALIPLIMPPDIPIWILCLSVAFAVIIGKEAFGGTGMNIWNIALLSRVFVFFAYPGTISGDQVWVAGLESVTPGAAVDYGWWQTGFFNAIFERFGWSTFDASLTVVDGYSGATPLALAYEGGWEKVTQHYSPGQLWWGAIPGSVGETSKPLILVGALFLIGTGIASWRVMVGMMIGMAGTAMLLNAWGVNVFMDLPWYYHFYLGSFFFAMAFMATDPVTAAGTNKGKWIYGLLIGSIGLIIRVMNPAYPEGWMLSILFMNSFAPLIDHFILESNMKKRLRHE
ncbi:MAG TPA: NADH:ubiquinone reductase (Na(+)-transporting) subunit B [Saprospiraceae bacterium]|nr:NADH:ubiquinone reductase (Na(+)-transporting) subunit B [Saprospiraceae bacterium]